MSLSLKSLSFFAVLLACFFACKREPVVPEPSNNPGDSVKQYNTVYIPESGQRSGDANKGREYLYTGDYVSSGIPYSAFKLAFGSDPDNYLNRTGDNADIPPEFTALTHANGTKIVVANCFQCHGQMLNGEYIVGLGNAVGDFTDDQTQLVNILDQFITNPSPEYDAYANLRRSILATGSKIKTNVVGTNPADKLTLVLTAHRDRHSFEWSDNPLLQIPNEVIPTDIPPWWLLKKKHAMFYTGNGRGDFARIMMASALLTMTDTSEAKEIDTHFGDVLAYLYTLEPPAYPESIDQDLAEAGKQVFIDNCQICHGKYGADEFYPNFVVPLDEIGTDSKLAENNFAVSAFIDWYNQSWFGQGANAARFEAVEGYVAPPLDGIWASAPYLHNGSVPTIEDLLNSKQRPQFWGREYLQSEQQFNTSDYDYVKVGWNYEVRSSGGTKYIYDTTLPGHSNAGHTYGDELTGQERKAVIEYLKTL